MFGPPKAPYKQTGRNKPPVQKKKNSIQSPSSNRPPSTRTTRTVDSTSSDGVKKPTRTKTGPADELDNDYKELSGLNDTKQKESIDNADSVKELKELVDRLKMVTQERDKYKTDLDKVHKELIETTEKREKASKKDKELEKDHQDLTDLKGRMKVLSEEKNKQDTDLRLLQTKAKKTEQILQQKILELQQETSELKTRLSGMFGAKLQDNNPNIADFSDGNRPTKLAERFSELYDNEWTNCFEVTSMRPGGTEKETIRKLLQVCATIFERCRETASKELQELTRAIEIFSPEQTGPMVKNLKERRKQRYQFDTERIKKKLEPSMANVLKTDLEESHFKEYWTKCLDIFWLMAIQDPPVSMDTQTDRKGEVLDAATYRPYTRRGRYIEYIVWPALYLTEEGPVLCKGVAQGTDASKYKF